MLAQFGPLEVIEFFAENNFENPIETLVVIDRLLKTLI